MYTKKGSGWDSDFISNVVVGYITCDSQILIADITVEPAVQRFLYESEAFGSSFWRESV